MDEVEIKERLEPVEFASFLRQCADAIDLGEPVEVTLHGKQIKLSPTGKFKVKYEAEKDKHELEMEMSWREAA